MNGLITAVSLPSMGFSGTLPPAVGALVGLTVLDLSSNAIHGTVPSAIALLTNLNELTLNYNRMTGTLPRNLQALGNLVYLDLRYNVFSGSVPTFFVNMSELVVIYADGNAFSGQVSSLLCDHVVDRNVTVSLKNNHFSCYQEKCWGNNMAVTSRSLGDSLLGCHPTQAPTTSPPSKTPTLAPTEDSKMTVASASLSSDLLSAIIVSVVGGLLLIVFLFIIMRRLMRKKYVIRRQREQRLQQLPIHRALLSRQIYTNAEFMELLDNHIDTARELDYDENTAIDIVLRSQNRITVSAEAIALLLDDSIPLVTITKPSITLVDQRLGFRSTCRG